MNAEEAQLAVIRYAALSSAGHRYKSEDRDRVDDWCAERVKLGESCEVYLNPKLDKWDRPRGGIELIGMWRPAHD